MTQSPGQDVGPIGQVAEGMRVLDSDGAEIGSVDLIKMGDPDAVTTEGQLPPTSGGTAIPGMAGIPPGGPGGVAAGMPSGAGGPGVPGGFLPAGVAGIGAEEPDVPPALAERLLRSGYVKIDSKGLFHRDLYVGAEQIDRVADDTVHLNAIKDQVTPEG